MKDKTRYDIHVLENKCASSKLNVYNALNDIREHASLFCLSITESFDDLKDDLYLNDYELEQVKDNLYHNY